MSAVETRRGEQGFMLLAMVVAIFLVLLALAVAAPKVAEDLRRDRELETIQRGNQYVRAIQLYYRKFGHYPGSMDALTKSNNIRFLRQQYIDPMTGKSDWRLIHVGEAKTTVKGFFGQPLAGLPGSSGGLGSAAGMSSGIGGSSTSGSSGSAFGSSSGSAFGSSSSGTSGLGGSSSPGTTLGGTTASGATGSTGSSDSSSSSMGGIGSQSASSFTGGGAPFVGVGIPKDGESITILNEQTNYHTWEFIYDPRIEQLKAAAGLLGGSSANGSLGTSPSSLGSPSGINGTSSSPFGSSPSTTTTPSSGSSGSSSPQ